MNKIPGYTITKKLNETKYCTIYSGYQNGTSGQNPLIFRVFSCTQLSPVEISGLKHVHESIRKTGSDFVEIACDIVAFRDEICFVFEETEVITLHQFLDNKPLKTEIFLKIASQLSTALITIHDRSIIHSSIRPQNILICDKTHHAKLANIRTLFCLPNEKEQIYNKEFIAEVLPYISPEQTGRMNREMDYRTDFYSLGITFYKMLTGEEPFTSNDPMEIIHNHIAGNPCSPSNINMKVPEVLSHIVMRLISKNSEDRYQSGEGLKADLENCLYQLQKNNSVESFTIGRRDIPKRFQISQKLYGRQNEIESLMNAFDRVVSQEHVEMMLVKGYSGIGKSALVHEINRPIVQRKGYFIKGKYEQLKKDIPYSAITQAFHGLVKHLLTESEDMISRWKDDVINALGQNGQVIIDVIPEFELLIGEQPSVNPLGPAESQNRFNMVFESFIKVFTKKEHPLVIFLDDLQWIDLASLNLLKLLMQMGEMGNLFLIGAYRDNEVDQSHPLMMTLSELVEIDADKALQPEKNRAIINSISLNPLNEISVNELIADTLNCSVENSLPLAELVCKKTDGNPFFIKQFLNVLYEEKLLRHRVEDFNDRNTAMNQDSATVRSLRWWWDMEKVLQMRACDNVVDLMSRKLSRLSTDTKGVLKLAACIGSRFEIDILATVNEKPEEDTFRAISEAINRGFIVFTENTYSFLHDRVQEATYNLIPDKNRSALHYKIGRLMYKLTNVACGIEDEIDSSGQKRYGPAFEIHQLSKELEEKIFSIVDQINHGITLMTDQEERYEVAGLNLIAGKKAKAATAYGPALKYLKTGMELLEKECWQVNYNLTFDLNMERAECEYLDGNFEQAEILFDSVIQEARTKIEKARAYTTKIDLYTNLAMYKEAIELGVEGLRMFNISLSTSPGKIAVLKELFKVQLYRQKHNVKDLCDLPLLIDPEKKAAMEILMCITPAAYFTKMELSIVMALKMVCISLKYGNTNCSPYAYLLYGCILIVLNTDDAYGPIFRSIFGSLELSYEFGLIGFKLNKQLGNTRLLPKLNNVFGTIINHWSKHAKINIEYLKKGFKYGIENGDLIFPGYCIYNIFTCMIIKGDSIDSIYETTERYSNFVKKLDYPEITSMHTLAQRFVLNLKGLTDNYLGLSDSDFNENEFIDQLKSNKLNACLNMFYGTKLMLSYLFGNYSYAMDMAKEYRKFQKYNVGMIQDFLYCLFYPLTLVTACENTTARKKRIYLRELKKNCEKLKRLSNTCPENFLHKYLLVSAEIARITGKDSNAMELYDQAIESAHENEYTQNEAIANELAGSFYLARGMNRIAKVYMKEAYDCFYKWGATRKLLDLEEKYPQLDLLPEPVKSKEYTGIASQGADPLASLDMGSILKASQTLSETIDLEKLLHKLMDIVIENAGASKGYVILEHKGGLYVEAESSLNGVIDVDKTVSVETRDDVAHSVINYVKRTKQHIVLNDTADNNTFMTDPYIIKNCPKSTLCMPIVKQTRLVGILYLENSITSNAFTTERIETLRLLSSQVAISLENAVYYRNLQELNKELKQLVTAMESIEEAIVITDINGKIFYANPSLEHITGYKPEDVAGENMSIFNSDNQEQTAYHDMWDRVAGGDVWSGQIVSRKKDGTLYTERITVSPVYDTQGRIVNFVAVKNDITGEIKLEARLRNKQKLEAIGTLAGGIAHDFNNLLMAIIGYTELTRDQLAEESEERDNLDQALKASYNAANMIQRILTFSRQGEQDQMQFNITPIVKDTLRLVRMSMPTTIALEQNIHQGIGEILADPTQIQQVLINLCTNAEYAMRGREGKLKVELGMENVERDFAEREGLQTLNCVKLTVTDNGIGMPPEVAERIFDPFFTTKKIGDGTGMGLAIAHGIIKNHGGAITVSSDQGNGTEFSIFFPVVNCESELVHEKIKLPEQRGDERVLFIDDEESIVNIVKLMLESLGYKVVTETESTRALERFRQHPDRFDIIITDYSMSGLTGIELAKEMLKIKPGTPIILCTGSHKDIIPEKARDIGISAYITKPCNSIKLGNTIRKVLGKRLI